MLLNEPITPTERLYLGGDAYSTPMVLQRTGANGTWVLYNIGRDYLGSITDIVDNDNTSSAYHYRYDPWGKLVNYSRVQPYFLGRGYTGHEYLPWFGLINDNARLYDPLLGRFLSPDPYVQDPDFTQNYNRYSYCLNNPLKYTDESGEILTWNIGNNGFGVNLGWGNGYSFGIYGELGPRLGGNGLGYGATISQSLDYNLTYQHLTTTSSASCYASFACFTASASVSYSYDIGYKTDAFGWSVGAGLGFGDSISNWGPYVSYGSSGCSYGIGGFYDQKSSSLIANGEQSVGLNAKDPIPATDEYLIRLQQLWYPDAPMDHIDDFSVENVPASILKSMNEKKANAQTALKYNKRTGELTGMFSVYYSERAFNSARQLYITMGHEFVHVSNYLTAYCLGYNSQNHIDLVPDNNEEITEPQPINDYLNLFYSINNSSACVTPNFRFFTKPQLRCAHFIRANKSFVFLKAGDSFSQLVDLTGFSEAGIIVRIILNFEKPTR